MAPDRIDHHHHSISGGLVETESESVVGEKKKTKFEIFEALSSELIIPALACTGLAWLKDIVM